MGLFLILFNIVYRIVLGSIMVIAFMYLCVAVAYGIYWLFTSTHLLYSVLGIACIFYVLNKVYTWINTMFEKL
jgi:hypothetical protein